MNIIYGIFGREISEYTVIYGIYTALTSPLNLAKAIDLGWLLNL
jgi:hypothetical protein